MNILSVAVDTIDVGERLRAIDTDYAALLADSMAQQGQMTPVEVRNSTVPGRYILVAGAHRLAALKLAGIADAACVLFEGTDLQARLREIDENLVRHELTALDRATFLAERKTVYEALHPETKHGGDRSEGKRPNLATRFTDDAAERIGISERAVRRAIQRHNSLHPDVRSRISGTWLADHGAQLDALSRAVPSEQLRAVGLMFGDVAEGGTRPGSVAEALAQVRGIALPVRDLEEAAFAGFLARWRRSEGFRTRVRAFVARERGK